MLTETTPHAGPPPHGDEAFCLAMLPEVSRTFALSIELLPDSLREPVRVGYLLCRIVDTIEDDPALAFDVREALFDAFDAALLQGGSTSWTLESLAARSGVGDGAERALIVNAGAVLRRYEAQPPEVRDALRPPILEMSRGMRAYARRTHAAGRLRLADVADLERYCFYVAGTVGELLTSLFLQALPDLAHTTRSALRGHAVPFGLALQLVNIVKDCAEDQERGVCFVPEAVVAARGLTVEQLTDPAHRDAALGAVADVCAVAGAYLRDAFRYTGCWPADGGTGESIRLFCLVPLVLALETLAVVVRGDDTLVPGRTPKVGREVVAEVLERCRAASAGEAALRRLGERYGLS